MSNLIPLAYTGGSFSFFIKSCIVTQNPQLFFERNLCLNAARDLNIYLIDGAFAYESNCVSVPLTYEAFVPLLGLCALPMLQCKLVFLVQLSDLSFDSFGGYIKYAGTWCGNIGTKL